VATPRIKRAYEAPSPDDGQRVLVDRLWPRGVRKEALKLDLWLKEIAPSTGLREWFDHDPAKWVEFKRRYAAELDANPDAVAKLRAMMATGPVTLIYGARDTAHNDAVAVADYLRNG